MVLLLQWSEQSPQCCPCTSDDVQGLTVVLLLQWSDMCRGTTVVLLLQWSDDVQGPLHSGLLMCRGSLMV